MDKRKRKLRKIRSPTPFVLSTPSSSRTNNNNKNALSNDKNLTLNDKTALFSQNVNSNGSSNMSQWSRHKLTYTPKTLRLMKKQEKAKKTTMYQPILVLNENRRKRKYSEVVVSNNNNSKFKTNNARKKRRLSEHIPTKNKPNSKMDAFDICNVSNLSMNSFVVDTQSNRNTRKKRQSLSSNAVKKAKTKTKKIVRKRKTVKKTVKKPAKKTVKSRSKSENENNRKKSAKRRIMTRSRTFQSKVSNVCPLLTALVRSSPQKSRIALVSHSCLSTVASQMSDIESIEMIRKFDECLCLISRAEMLLKSEESARILSISKAVFASNDWNDDWKNIYRGRKRGKSAKNAVKSVEKRVKKRGNKRGSSVVRFCCYDLSTVTTSEYGELSSNKHICSISRLLVSSAKIWQSLFSNPRSASFKKCISLLICEYAKYIALNANSECISCAKYILSQFVSSQKYEIAYPFSCQVYRYLSSQIRFDLRSIWNANEFLDFVPIWYENIGSYSLENQEFIPYHSAELSLQLQNYPTSDSLAFFAEMFVEVSKSKNCDLMFGIFNQSCNNHNFYKYLKRRWKLLKQSLVSVKTTKTKALYYYLPLLDFKAFLQKL